MRRVIYNKVRARELGAVLVLVILMTGLVACSGAAGSAGSDDSEPVVPTEQLKAISFSSGLQEEEQVTRAAGLEDMATSFKVWGYKNDAVSGDDYTSYQTVFPGFTVNWTQNTAYTTTSNTHDWEYVGQAAGQDIKYWDFSAKAYRYFAVAGSGYTANAPNGNYGADGATITASVDASSEDAIAAAPYFSRLWFKAGSALTGMAGTPVTLEFLKPFARVRFLFTFAEGVNVDRTRLSSPSFKPANDTDIATAGTVTVSYPLIGTATSETYTTTAVTATIDQFDIDYYENNETYTPSDTTVPTIYDNSPHKWYTVLPQSLGAFTVTVTVGAKVSTATVPAEYMNWVAGYEYTYKFKILENGGVALDIVQVAINDWVDVKPIDHSVYNW